jgi:hypothetical protein
MRRRSRGRRRTTTLYHVKHKLLLMVAMVMNI